MSKLITANCDGIVGYTRFGYWELNLTDAEYEDYWYSCILGDLGSDGYTVSKRRRQSYYRRLLYR